jgi:hypothetical protein
MNPFESDDEDEKPSVPIFPPEEQRNIGDGGSVDEEDGGDAIEDGFGGLNIVSGENNDGSSEVFEVAEIVEEEICMKPSQDLEVEPKIILPPPPAYSAPPDPPSEKPPTPPGEQEASTNPFDDDDDDDDDEQQSPMSDLTPDTSRSSSHGGDGSKKSQAATSPVDESFSFTQTHKDFIDQVVAVGYDRKWCMKMVREKQGDTNLAYDALEKMVLGVSRGFVGGMDLKHLWQSPLGVRVTSWMPDVVGRDGSTHTEYVSHVTHFATGAGWQCSHRWSEICELADGIQRAVGKQVALPLFDADRFATTFGSSDKIREKRLDICSGYLRDIAALAEAMLHGKAKQLIDGFFKVNTNLETFALRKKQHTARAGGGGVDVINNSKAIFSRRRSNIPS